MSRDRLLPSGLTLNALTLEPGLLRGSPEGAHSGRMGSSAQSRAWVVAEPVPHTCHPERGGLMGRAMPDLSRVRLIASGQRGPEGLQSRGHLVVGALTSVRGFGNLDASAQVVGLPRQLVE